MKAACTYGDISRERHDRAPLETEIGDEPAVGGVDLGGLIGIVAAQLADRGAAVAGAGPIARRDNDRDAERQQREEANAG